MPLQETLDPLLDEIAEISGRLAAALEQGRNEEVPSLIQRRGDLATRLDRSARARGLSAVQRSKLRDAIESGRRAKKSAAIRREIKKTELLDLRSAQRLQQAFKPYRQLSGRRLDVDL